MIMFKVQTLLWDRNSHSGGQGMSAKRLKFCSILGSILFIVFLLCPSVIFSRNSDYSISLIQKPLATYPVIVQSGNSFEIQFKASASTSGFVATLKTTHFSKAL